MLTFLIATKLNRCVDWGNLDRMVW